MQDIAEVCVNLNREQSRESVAFFGKGVSFHVRRSFG